MSLRRRALTGIMAAAGVALLTGQPAGAADSIKIGWLSSLTGPLSSAAIAENEGVKFDGDRRRLERIYALFPVLASRRRQPASRLSGGQQQILAVAQSIIGELRLLMLDEPSGGLAPILVDRILDVVQGLCREGIGVLLVEQLVEKALRRAGYAYLLETGRIAGEGSAATVAQGDLLRRIYLGDHGRMDEA